MSDKSELVETEVVTNIVPVTPMDLIIRAQNESASIEQMERLFELQLRYQDNEAQKAFNAALASFKEETITIVKDREVAYSGTKYNHASIGNVVNSITPYLSRHGLYHSWSNDQVDGSIKVTCKLAHKLGHSETVSLEAGKDDSGKKNQIQQIASTVTYLQRYTLLAITGLATIEQDDDGAGSGDDVEYITESQACDYDAKINEIQPNEKLLFQYLSVNCKRIIECPAQIPAKNFTFAVEALEGKRK